MQVTHNTTLSAGKKTGSYVQLRVVDTPNEMTDAAGLPSVPFRDLPILGAFCLEKGSNTYVKTGGRSYINPENDPADVQRAKKSLKVMPLDSELYIGNVSDYVVASGKQVLAEQTSLAEKVQTAAGEAPRAVLHVAAEGEANKAALADALQSAPLPQTSAAAPINPTKWPFPNSQEAGVTLRPPVAPRANKKSSAAKKAAAPAKKAAAKKPAVKKSNGKAAGKSK